MSNDLINQLSEVKTKLQERKAALLAEVAQIDKALGAQPTAAPKAPKSRATGIGEDIIAFVRTHPQATIREIQAGFPNLKPSTVEATVRNLAARGMLAKDDQTPRHFSIPEAKPESPELSEPHSRLPKQPEPTKPNGAARPQQQPSPKG
jgi:hypothetical protein